MYIVKNYHPQKQWFHMFYVLYILFINSDKSIDKVKDNT